MHRRAHVLIVGIALIAAGCSDLPFSADRAVSSRVASAPAGEREVFPAVRWRDSQALGVPHAGRLVRGVALPAAGRHFSTWDPVLRRAPNRAWRRWGTDDTVRRTLAVARAYRRAHPSAPRLMVGDLSRPRGGEFGRRWGIIGHASHQNGLDVDVYYPRRDRRERAPTTVGQVDLRLSQELLDHFVAAGAVVIFTGPSLALRGPPGVAQRLIGHDNHLHVRFPS